MTGCDDAWCRQFAVDTRDYLLHVCERLELNPIRIGIDAPSSPRAVDLNRRLAEAALDQAGISCFGTPGVADFERIREKIALHRAAGGSEARLPHANQIWMLSGFALFEVLREIAECLEVFPQATMRTANAGHIHKSKPGAVALQLSAVSKYTGWPDGASSDPGLGEIAWGAPHDQLDAYLSSWVASLPVGERSGFGHAPEDVIWVPKLEGMPWSNVASAAVETPAMGKISAGGSAVPGLRRTLVQAVALGMGCPCGLPMQCFKRDETAGAQSRISAEV